jgi:hypothetical protein
MPKKPKVNLGFGSIVGEVEGDLELGVHHSASVRIAFQFIEILLWLLCPPLFALESKLINSRAWMPKGADSANQSNDAFLGKLQAHGKEFFIVHSRVSSMRSAGSGQWPN